MRCNISRQFLLVGILIVFAFTGLSIYTYFQMRDVELKYRQALLQDAPAVGYANEVVSELWCMNAQARGYMLTGDPKYLKAMQDSKQRLNASMAAIEKINLTPKAQQEFGLLAAVTGDYQKTLNVGIDMRDKMGMEETIKHLKAGGDRVDGIGNVTKIFTRVVNDEMSERIKESEETIETLQLVMIVINTIIFLGAVALLLAMAKRIGRPLAVVVDAANRIADGDFRAHTIAYTQKDEIGDLVQAFTAMSAKLRELVREITAVSEQVAGSSQQLNATAEQSAMAASQVAATVTSVAAGTTTQVDAIAKTVSAVKKMASAIDHIAASAASVSHKSGDASRAATAGGQAVADASAQMAVINTSVTQSAQVVKRLGDSSKQIGEIVDVISGIAGQTNLLALNAAIEAARAGEQGRGFAVVAEEVRKLAEQSQEAAHKIGNIIREIQGETETAVIAMNNGTDEVARGTEVISQTGERFKHIVALVQELNHQIQEISTATEAVSASSEAVVVSVDSIKAVAGETADNTQTISASAEEQSASMQEIAASSQELSKMAENLQSAVAKFRL